MTAALILMGSPAAQADNATFVADARALGFPQWDDVLIRMGLSACRFLQPHLRRTPADVAQHIRRFANVGPDQAHQFMTLAVHEYCPQLAGRLSS
ncbi:DUF732 domain-containing protein [Mycolicibacterium sp. XJ879]